MSITTTAFVFEGDLRADGTITLDARPTLPPGRVRVTVQVLAQVAQPADGFPDPPWPDDCISAPLDLPHFGNAHQVQPRPGGLRLPEPFIDIEEETR